MNTEKQITHVLAGNPWSAHRRACAIEKEIVQSKLDHPVDICLVTNGGTPLDLDFYQTVKGIDTASRITRQGGIIIMASSCHSGLGPPVFCARHRDSNAAEEVLAKIRSGQCTGVDWQNQVLAKAQMEHRIYLYSDLPDDDARSMKVEPIHSIEEGLERALALLGSQAEIAVIPEGPLVLPVMGEP
jgi:nickel-dependent lactate racemase